MDGLERKIVSREMKVEKIQKFRNAKDVLNRTREIDSWEVLNFAMAPIGLDKLNSGMAQLPFFHVETTVEIIGRRSWVT